MDKIVSTFKKSHRPNRQWAPPVTTIVYHMARWILGLVFIYASFDKIIHPHAFAVMVNNYQLLPGEIVNLTALVLPWLELLMGICLITGWLMQGTVIVSNVLLFTFTMVLLYNLHRGLDISCGCFSTSSEKNPANMFTIARDSGFLLLSFYLYWFNFVRLRASDSRSDKTDPTP